MNEAPTGPSWLRPATLARVIDGDTIEADVDLGFDIKHEVRLRIDGYNAPESKGVQKAAGFLAKNALAGLIQDRTLLVETIKLKGKDVTTFERYAAKVWVETSEGYILVADRMKALGFDVARPS